MVEGANGAPHGKGKMSYCKASELEIGDVFVPATRIRITAIETTEFGELLITGDRVDATPAYEGAPVTGHQFLYGPDDSVATWTSVADERAALAVAAAADERVVAIRNDARFGRNTCSALDECYTDADLVERLDDYDHRTVDAALIWAAMSHDVFVGQMAEADSYADPRSPNGAPPNGRTRDVVVTPPTLSAGVDTTGGQ